MRAVPDRQYLERVFGNTVLAERTGLFSGATVTASRADLRTMARFVSAMEIVSTRAAYRAAVGVDAKSFPAVAAMSASVCMGYDFHLTDHGPKLIEINTNAGGLLLVAELMSAWGLDGGACLDAAFEMFAEEWDGARGALAEPRPLVRVAIVDEAPAGQYLYPEFEQFAALFEQRGVAAVIADPADLDWDAIRGRLVHRGEPIDLVYNRLTDFELVAPAQAALRAAWIADAVVVTPHPLAHRLFADKRNLVLLANPAFRAGLGLSTEEEAALSACLLPIVEVKAADAESLWARRKQLFFKPATGYGSRAAYRGDKMTKRVFDEVLAGGYVAQEFAPPAEVLAGETALKYDVRNYAYRGRVLAVAARLYQGQTTNFRTPGGGFAPVVMGPDEDPA